MSVNKPTNIEPPKSGDAKPKRTSLLERASGAFGLDRLAPAAVPDKLEDEKAKKFAPKRKAEPSTPPEMPRRRASDRFAQPQPTGAATPVPPVPPAAPSEPDKPVVTLAGPKQHVVRSLLREQGLIDPDGGASMLLEEFRIVKRQVLATAKAKPGPQARRVLVQSRRRSD